MTPEAQEYNFSPEEQEAIRIQFEEWEWILEEHVKSAEDLRHEDIDRFYETSLDRDSVEDSYFDYQELDVVKLKGGVKLEDFIGDVTGSIETQPEEFWIRISINPSDISKPRVGLYESDYYTENLNIYLSNLGRGFEYKALSRFPRTGIRLEKIRNERHRLARLSETQIDESVPIVGPIGGQTLHKFQELLVELKANP